MTNARLPTFVLTMSVTTTAVPNSQAVFTARSLRNLYVTRASFSIAWVILVALFTKSSPGFAYILLVIYPAWDVFGTWLDIRSNGQTENLKPQYINAGISAITTIGVIIALQTDVPEAIMVFGAWAILTGLIQLIMGIRRRKLTGGQWPMMISGGQSMLGGTSFILLAHDPGKGIASLAGYAAFGAFYYLLAAFRLHRTLKTSAVS